MTVTISPEEKKKLDQGSKVTAQDEKTMERVAKAEKYRILTMQMPWLFNWEGNLKTEYRNRKCVCGSRLKMKNCCGVRYYE